MRPVLLRKTAPYGWVRLDDPTAEEFYRRAWLPKVFVRNGDKRAVIVVDVYAQGNFDVYAAPWALEILRVAGSEPGMRDDDEHDTPAWWAGVVDRALRIPDMTEACEFVDEAVMAFRAAGAPALENLLAEASASAGEVRRARL